MEASGNGVRRAAFALGVIVALMASACSGAANRAASSSQTSRFVDVHYPMPSASPAIALPHAVDGTGALWYIHGQDVVREPEPGRRQVATVSGAASGNLFWYDNSLFVLTGDGKNFVRVGKDLGGTPVPVPSAFVPAAGVIADARHRALIVAQSSPSHLGVVDVWKWYDETLPEGIAPFAASLAGGPHGKRFLVVGDQRGAFVLVKNRWNAKYAFVQLPENTCFAASASPVHVPVDVRGRDGDRTWVATGEHVLTIELSTKKILRVWDTGGCATRIVDADADSATVLVSAPSDKGGFTSSVVRVDREGVHPQTQYGQIDGLGPAATIDRFGRLWWFDTATNAFVCRTPLG